MSVWMHPGTMPFTCTLCAAHSLLSAFVSCPRPPLAAAYAGTNLPPCATHARADAWDVSACAIVRACAEETGRAPGMSSGCRC